MKLRDHRRSAEGVRKGTSDLVRTTQQHRDRKHYQREQQEHQRLMDDFFNYDDEDIFQ